MNDDWRQWKFAGIYCIEHNESGKKYVGQAQNIAIRISSHSRCSGKCIYLYRAINYYGWESFSVYILDKTEDVSELNIKEQYWIDKLNVTDQEKGYNICPIAGCTRGVKQRPETLELLSKIRKGRRCSEETKEKMRLVHLNRS